LESEFCTAAAYDPAFHGDVFKAMGRALSEERRQEVGLDQQQDLHDRLIDKGLAALYQGFLDDATGHVDNGSIARSMLLSGKAYRAINQCADETGAALIVAGRHGHHNEGSSEIGACAEALARTAGCNVLLTNPRKGAQA
jgi:nucleotide-binding universal stress UspA family protein